MGGSESWGDSPTSQTKDEGQLEKDYVSDHEDQYDSPADPLARRKMASESSDYGLSQKPSSYLSEVEQQEREERATARPPKRPARPSLEADIEPRPPKRNKGNFSSEYLGLLNEDIQDAVTYFVPHDWPELSQSQIGLAVWTPLEKELFFEALSRLGRDDVPGIARRVKSKGELEILQYLRLLQHAVVRRKEKGTLVRSHVAVRTHMADFPAAVELGPECCNALDEAADGLAVRCENRDEAQQWQKWGGYSLITPSNLEQLLPRDTTTEVSQLPSLDFFKTETWLKLSERLFMNAASDDENWQSVGDGDLPSIRATALEDFHSLAVSITKRLMSAAIYFATSRIRSKRTALSPRDGQVGPRDVEAAAASLGLQRNHRTFWVGCARRLKLEVFDFDRGDGFDKGGPMSYDEVVKRLADGVDSSHHQPPYQDTQQRTEKMSLDDDDVGGDGAFSPDSPLDSDDSIKEEDSANEAEQDAAAEAETQSDAEARHEADEIIHHSITGPRNSKYNRDALVAKVKAERRAEQLADALDRQASVREERRMWALLGRDPPPAVTLKPGDDNTSRPASRGTAEDVHPVGKGWRETIRYVSEWEVAPEVGRPNLAFEKRRVAKMEEERKVKKTKTKTKEGSASGESKNLKDE